MIGRDGGSESENSVLSAKLDECFSSFTFSWWLVGLTFIFLATTI